MKGFINEIRKHPTKDREGMFLKVFDLSKDDFDLLLFSGLINPNAEVDTAEKQLNKMNQLQFASFIQTELERYQRKYPSGKPVSFDLFILDEHDDFVKEKLGGVSAFTDWNGRICFILDPDEKVRSVLKSVIAHEYHHHWRMSKLGATEENETLLDRMVLEGLAEHFVREELGETYLGPYKDALSEDKARFYLDTKFKTHLFDKGADADPFMFGDKEQNLPFWGGYSIGYYLVKWFIDRNKNVSIEKLTLLPSEEYIDVFYN
ncbi:uncharacterized protein YjaZ [Scopulibacillus darangshiensis]|uniref:Uncharacterized protein YjaZ n=2 Tax=Scopulibacillus darangshiensis TaxID=442528 RepID=A0A4R2P2L3_9BACL|nr:uncharacterized protein YjaZ [Scopulibacillus darangshiensis]